MIKNKNLFRTIAILILLSVFFFLFTNQDGLIQSILGEKTESSSARLVSTINIDELKFPEPTELSSSTSSHAKLQNEYHSWVAYWDHIGAIDSIQKNPNVLKSISPSWYKVNADGSVSLKSAKSQSLADIARSQNMKIIPSISNSSPDELSEIIANEANTNNHISKILREVTANDYDGIDIDYEHINSFDKDNFTNFIRKLSEELNKIDRKLTIAILWKADPVELIEGFSDSRAAQDWVEIGKAVDEFRIMAYDFTHSYNAQGPIAPDYWIEEILKYAILNVDKSKIVLGLPWYAYEWAEGSQKATALVFNDIKNLKDNYPESIISDEISKGEKKLDYDGVNGKMTIWYQDSKVTQDRIDLANKYGVNKIIFWRLGGEDYSFWKARN